MPKRFTDTNIWDKPWFIKLSTTDKCAISYIKDRCDNVGVWTPSFALAEFVIGTKVDWEALPGLVNGNITILPNGKWYLPDFCTFQYGELEENTNNKARLSYVNALKKHGLWKGHRGDSESPKEKDKEKEKDLDKDKDKKEYAQYVHMTEQEYVKLVHDYGKGGAADMIAKLDNYKGSCGKKYKSDYRAILSWVREELGLAVIVSRDGPTVQTTPGTMRIIEELRAKRRERKLGANE